MAELSREAPAADGYENLVILRTPSVHTLFGGEGRESQVSARRERSM